MFMTNIQKLFSYGTLQQENVQIATFGRILKGTADSLTGYRLDQVKIEDAKVIATSGKEYHPILIKTNDPNDTVIGTIFEISSNELKQADTYEVDAYVRVEGNFASGKTAWIYADARQQSQMN